VVILLFDGLGFKAPELSWFSITRAQLLGVKLEVRILFRIIGTNQLKIKPTVPVSQEKLTMQHNLVF